MTPSLAKEYVNLAAHSYKAFYRDGEKDMVSGYPLGALSASFRADILSSVAPADIFFRDESGAGVRVGAIRARLAVARAVLERHDCEAGDDSDPVVPGSPNAADFPDLVVPNVLRVAVAEKKPNDPPFKGAIRWPLCREQALTEKTKRQSNTLLGTSGHGELMRALVDQPQRWLPRVTRKHLDAVDQLYATFPNFGPALDLIARTLRFQFHARQALRLPALLLLGPPGIGKTEFSRRLADALGMAMEFRSLAETSAGFVLSGLNNQWHQSRPGLIAELVVRCPQGKPPLMVFDELDKVRKGSDYAVDKSLLSLLEPASAARFRDENLDIELDTRPVSYLLTANRIDGLKPELLSRLRVVEVQTPSQDQMPRVVRSVDNALRDENPALKRMFHPLDQTVIDGLAAQSPRLLRRLLEDGYAAALDGEKQRGRRRLRLKDLGLAKSPEKDNTASGVPARRPIPTFLVLREGWQWIH